MATLQASLLCKPCLSFPSSSPPRQRFYHSSISSTHHHSTPLSFNPLCLSKRSIYAFSSDFLKLRFRPRLPSIFCTFPLENASLLESNILAGGSDAIGEELDVNGRDGESLNLTENSFVLDSEESRVDGIGAESSKIELQSGLGELNLESNEVDSEGKSEKPVESEGNGRYSTKVGRKEAGGARLQIVVFFVGLWARASEGIQKALCDFLYWWPFWRQEKRLARLIAEADANLQDAAKQSALLVELNKRSPESVIKRFEQRDRAVDSRAVAEYLRALVVTNAIAEYLPDEESGKPSSLPTLLQVLKHRASGNTDEPFLSPGISEKQPLHVVMVDPKVSNKSRFAQELISTILFTVAVGLVWVMGATALQKYIGSLGGIGTSGVGSRSSYTPKELNKEVMPDKNVKTFKDVKGCDDAKEELEEVVEYLRNPAKFTRLGGKLPKGILLTGALGTGKTLLAKAIAGEAGVPFFYRAGSEFEEMCLFPEQQEQEEAEGELLLV